MGKQPGRHTDWLCNRRGLSAADRGRDDICSQIRQPLSKA